MAAGPVLVVDFGAQYAQLIARRVREANVYSELVPHSMPVDEMLAKDPQAIILSGGPASVFEPGAPRVDKKLFDAGVPVLGICRGFQELNVALGGSLHQKLHEVEGFIEHREDPSAPVEVQYAPSHAMHVQPGGVLEALGLPTEFEVNSIHTQGIDRLAPGLRAEALAPDGLVEAVSVKDGKAFALAVQWHPEWQVSSNPIYLAIFQAFGDACRRRATQRDADASVNA